jgi:MFS/sugar transport protein
VGKHVAYIIGMVFWAAVQIAILLVRPGQISLVLWTSFLAGLSVSAAHVLPDAMFPDVIEWDELRTGLRQEGIYYGVKNFIRKLTGAFAIFFGFTGSRLVRLPGTTQNGHDLHTKPAHAKRHPFPDRTGGCRASTLGCHHYLVLSSHA